MQGLTECEGGVHRSEAPNPCYCVAPVLKRLGNLQPDKEYPHGIASDRVHIQQIAPFVTHICCECKPGEKTECYDASGEVRQDLDGFRNPANPLTASWPEQRDRCIVLPPADPVPELKRQVLREAAMAVRALTAAERKAIERAWNGL